MSYSQVVTNLEIVPVPVRSGRSFPLVRTSCRASSYVVMGLSCRMFLQRVMCGQSGWVTGKTMGDISSDPVKGWGP